MILSINNFDDYGLQQWLLRVRSGIGSLDAPENRQRFQALAKSIQSSYQDAPSRNRDEIRKVEQSVRLIAEGTNKDDHNLSELVRKALEIFENP